VLPANSARAKLTAFDYLVSRERDAFGRGRFDQQPAVKPPLSPTFPAVLPVWRAREDFVRLLSTRRFDAVLVQTVMTYWYLGVREVIEDVRKLQPHAKIILGGVYATLCPGHARSLGADQVLEGLDLKPLGLPLSDGLPLWESVDAQVGIVKITEGCPFPVRTAPCLSYTRLSRRGRWRLAWKKSGTSSAWVLECRILRRRVAVPTERISYRFSSGAAAGFHVSFHTPNALNARFITPEIARLMVRAGFKTFFLGLESNAYEWQRKTGGKVYSEEFGAAVRALTRRGASSITAYIIIGTRIPRSRTSKHPSALPPARAPG